MIRGKGRKILSFMRIRTLDLKISRLNALLLSHGKVNNELSQFGSDMFLAYCFISNVEIVTGGNRSECKVLEAKSRAREMFKVLNGLSPSCLADLFLRNNVISGAPRTHCIFPYPRSNT